MTAAISRLRLIGLALLLSAAGGAILVAPALHAEAAGVEALLNQAKYWRSKGREDLAQQALRRAKALDPASPAVAGALSAGTPRPAPTRSAPKAAAVTARPAASSPAPARTAAPSPANRGGQARVAGFAALDQGNLPGASTQFEKALSVNRKDADALGGLGLVRLREGRFAEAADLLGQASRLGKADQWAQGLASARFFAGVGNARTLLAQGQVAEAQQQAEALVRSGYPEPAPALELLGQVYEKQGRYADAADLYRQASQGGGADEKRLQMRAARGRALAAAANGDDIGATREFQQGLLLDPDDPWIRYEFAEFMVKRGRVPEAESLLRSLASNGGADSLYAAALVNADLGRPAEAERLIAMIPETQRTAPMRAFAIGVKTDGAIAQARAMAKTGQQAQALAALRQLGAMPSIPTGKRAAIANALFELGDVPGAAQLAGSALDGEVSSLDDYEGLIGVLVRAGREDLAQLALQRAGRMAGTSAEGQRAHARMSAALMTSQADRARLAGRFAESFDILQSAYTAAPDNTEILSGLARLYQSGAMPARAAQTFQLVLARKPGDKDALLGLADSAQAAGDRDLSERAQVQALRAFPQDYQVHVALAGVERARGDGRAAVRLLKEARELYARQQGAAGAGAPGGNPFAGMGTDGSANPFRDQDAAAAPQVNPFALGGGTRLPATPAGYAPAGYSQAPYSQMPYTPASPVQGPTPAPDYPAQTGYGSMPASAAAPLPGPSFASSPAAPVYSADPVMNQIQSEIAALSQDTGPRADIDTSYRQRSGETGLSQLDEIKGSAKFSTGALAGRVFARAEASVIDAGRPTGSGLARFGRNATPEAQAIVDQVESPLVNADSQHASGVAFSAGYESDAVQIEAGTTPIGMGKTKPAFRAAVTPKLSENVRASAFAERKPVADSIVSYAGTRDPVTGERWGQVMRMAGGLGLSYDRDGSGVYAEGRYYRFDGTNVSKNTGFEANVGGYLRAHRGEHSALTVGLNVNYQRYDKSQNYFTFGNGSYFSPQSFISVGFPVNYTMENDRLDARAAFTPGFQSYSQDQSPIYPTDPVAQADLDDLKALNSDVRSYYDGVSKTGFALSAEGSLYYKISPTTRIGGQTSYNTFGSYDEFRSMLGVRQNFGSSK
ncbi:Flp pilus assembly protein TadD, contains TPR repeats [Novosphingobium sp. CF614]|uniref:cellulose biosynthesis protein BcsC n=1 Tax=Novosphingobium sp. CF614 TaxID=1884364 RepID=UPI0008E074CD|nr:cellulose biosynthesis protein BcsC [Novosphingobium sp. CF614]SFF91913.1 Flp pilus assembly protein TadD, contains TPR repeats [Novosphingobium sp. CF614]